MEHDTDDERIGQNIYRLRKEKGLSQRELASAMQAAGFGHWRQNTVSRIENGNQPIGTTAEASHLTEMLGNIFDGTAVGASLTEAGRNLTRTVQVSILRRTEADLIASLSNVGKLLRLAGAEPRLPDLIDRPTPEDDEHGEHPEEA